MIALLVIIFLEVKFYLWFDKKSSEYQTANLQNDNVSQAEAAKLLNVSDLEQCMSLAQLPLGQ